jgi:anti-sigma-K factor RskA
VYEDVKREESVELRRELAGEYVLGTLAGAARRRFSRWLATDATLRAEVAEWERRLASLNRVPPVLPPASVWAAIEHGIAGDDAAPITPTAAARRRRISQRSWQIWALAASVLAAVLGIGLVYQTVTLTQRMDNQTMAQAQILAQAQADKRELAMEVDRLAAPAATQQDAVYMAQLEAREERTSWGVTVEPRVGVLRVTVAGRFPVDRGHGLALWMVGPSGVPIPLGMLPSQPGTVELHMPPGVTVPDQFTLAVTREVAGSPLTGPPTPPILMAAPSWRLTG